ncbi:MAG: hypothetical protein PVG56_15640 [Anaerolineae bacterium]|jgi:hypothetical protein
MMNRCSPLIRVLLLGAIAIVNTPCLNASPSHELAMGIHTIRANDHLLQLAEDGGFTWLIQLLEWREVEPVPGEYFWEYPDWLVRAAEYYGLDLILRLDHPAEWALPVDVAAYAAFVQQVAARYQGRVTAYVIWNEPNLAAEWAGQPPDAGTYVDLLCAAQSATHSADPQALVISAGLAPTNHVDDSALDDRFYLQAMYDAGAAACFDILGAHPYGFAYPPTDPHGDHDSLNFARLADLRAIMVENGDERKPVWATELGWTTDPVGTEQQWLRVSEDEQSRYLLGALEQASQDWPWLERIAVWNMSTGLLDGDERRGYSILSNDGAPNPAYEALAKLFGEQGTRRVKQQEDGRQAEVLAPDVVIRLSDVEIFYPHWARPHCKSTPCRRWRGQFYVNEPGDAAWQLHMEIMQVEEPGNLVWINDQLLEPPAIPLRGRPDFASVWTAVEMPVPPELLRSGVNSIEIGSSPRLPVYQDARAHFESLQFRNLRLLKVP